MAMADRITSTMTHVGLSITLASISEAVAFFLGVLTQMPAVRSFALYAGVAILADYLLQLICFPAILVLDAHRKETGRLDCVPCVQLEGSDFSTRDYELHHGAYVWKDGFVKKLCNRCFADCLLHPFIKAIILIFAVLFAVFSLGYAIHSLPMGLDQQDSVPDDSYLQDYFSDVKHNLRVGPPVYFVIRGDTPTANWSIRANQNRICGGNGCPDDSLSTRLNAFVPQQYLSTFIAPNTGTTSWIDDYLQWIQASLSTCCRLDPGGNLCSITDTNPNCTSCRNWFENRPPPDQFRRFLSKFLFESECGDDCAVCGWGHSMNVALQSNQMDTHAVRFMSYHTPLQTQDDFISALKAARDLSSDLASSLDLNMYVYSVFYVYFEQYLHIVDLTILISALATAAVAGLSYVLVGSTTLTFQVVFAIALILCDLLGVMAAWGVSLNAVSAVNFVMGIGICIEFCIHISVAFFNAAGSNDERVRKALVSVGSSVFSGIFLTKFCGVVVLAFSGSGLFSVYFFRMYLAIVLLGGFNGFCVLPVLLSYVGPTNPKLTTKT